jgi:hypothetical protein
LSAAAFLAASAAGSGAGAGGASSLLPPHPIRCGADAQLAVGGGLC